MTITTEGKTFVYGVFDCDGHECADLIAVTHSQEKADELAYTWETSRGPRFSNQFMLIRPLEVDEFTWQDGMNLIKQAARS